MTDCIIPSKYCPKCETTKPIEQFSKDNCREDGRDSYCKACRREYHQTNRDRLIQRASEWQRNNPDRAAELARAWHAAHPEFNAAKNSRRRARKLEAGGTHNAADIQAQYKRQRGRCYYCHEKVGDTYHVDHIVPLSRGGSNDPDNLVIACPSCNCSKSDRLPSEWPQGNRLL